MSAGYQVKTIRLESGERLPLLLSQETGVPVWEVTLFILTALRSTGLATNTIAHAARGVMVGLQIFRYLGIDLNQRLEQGKLLSLSEVDELAKLAGLKQEELGALLGNKKSRRQRLVLFRLKERVCAPQLELQGESSLKPRPLDSHISASTLNG